MCKILKKLTADGVFRFAVVFSMITKDFPGLIKLILKNSLPKSMPITAELAIVKRNMRKKEEIKKVFSLIFRDFLNFFEFIERFFYWDF